MNYALIFHLTLFYISNRNQDFKVGYFQHWQYLMDFRHSELVKIFAAPTGPVAIHSFISTCCNLLEIWQMKAGEMKAPTCQASSAYSNRRIGRES